MVTVEEMQKYENEIISLRRDIHMHPEIGFDLERTAGFVAKKLQEYGAFEVVTGVAKTGVVAIFDSGRPGKTIGVRADMDALEMDELTDVPYRSVNDGRMHACGHDGHTAMALGVAHYIADHPDEFDGKIKILKDKQKTEIT